MTNFDKEYWESRYQENASPWDIGTVTPPLQKYIDQLTDTSLKILVPGAGNGYEFEYLINKGFTNSYVLDIAPTPGLRNKYAEKMHSLLSKNGKIAGVLFQFPLTEAGPPFGGSIEEYIELFSPFFTINTLSTAYNSIPRRMDKELFFIFEKK